MKKLLLASMIVCVSNGVMATSSKTSTITIKDTYKVEPTCFLSFIGSDSAALFGDVFTTSIISNVKTTGTKNVGTRKVSFAVDADSADFGDVKIVNPDAGDAEYTGVVNASEDVKFKLLTTKDLTKNDAGTYEATITVTATCAV